MHPKLTDVPVSEPMPLPLQTFLPHADSPIFWSVYICIWREPRNNHAHPACAFFLWKNYLNRTIFNETGFQFCKQFFHVISLIMVWVVSFLGPIWLRKYKESIDATIAKIWLEIAKLQIHQCLVRNIVWPRWFQASKPTKLSETHV